MFCKNCGEPMNDNQAICVKCGVKAGSGDKFCANCGQPVNPGADVCMNCGVAVKKPLGNIVDGTLGGQSKLVIALLCFFLGSIGIHNFVMGETKKGIFKIVMTFCFGISVIFMLIDLVKILTNTYEVNPDKII